MLARLSSDFPRSTRVARRLGVAVAAWLALLAQAQVAPGASAPPAAAAAVRPAANPSRSSTMPPNDLGGPFTLVQLKMLVPERIGAWKRTTVNVPLESSVPAPEPTVIFGYRQGKQNASLTISDAGPDSAAGAAQWKGPPNRRQTDSGSEYVYREGRHTVREIERRDSPAREVMLILANGLVISASGDGVDMAALKALTAGIPIASAEALVRPAK